MNISLKTADAIVEGAIKKASEIGVAMNVVVLDAGGHLKAFKRMDEAFLGSIDIATRKAKTSVLFKMNSEAVYEFSKPGAPAHGLEVSNDGLITFAGGIPILDRDGQMIGAIGVSGGAVDQDFEVASAGADVVNTL